MYKNLNVSLKTIYDFLNTSANTEQKENVAKWMLDNALRARGYNNFQDFDISGEKYFFDNMLKEINPRVSVDVGANIGEYTSALLGATKGIVIAFEPLDEPFSRLKEIQKLNQDRLILENKGVGLINEFLDIYFNDEATAHASFSKDVQSVPYLNNKLSKKIEVVSLDTYFQDKPQYEVDFLKIDTEGFEWEVLSGAKNLIKDKKPKAIQIEFNWHQMFRAQTLFSFSEMLKGYSPFQMLPNDLIRRDPKDPYSNIYHFSNFVFIRDDFYKR
ncbi:FkbM family methyltransferase [Polynucleobacter paneuropaeus]|nr:FkbM family methyltransferase [Polynucleobacter paneuropaeus]